MRRLLAARLGIGLVLALSPLIAGVAALEHGVDRDLAGDSVAVVFFACLVLLLSTPWWVRGPSRAERLESLVMVWCVVSFTIHLTWELAWLILRDAIRVSPDALWAYPWWAYIDGGDGRYATDDPLLVSVEVLSVANGVVGWLGLWLYRRPARRRGAVLLLMATAVVHLYSTSLYFLTEVLAGYPHVDTTSFVDVGVKFWMLNGLWLVVPVAVLRWGVASLASRGSPPTRVGPAGRRPRRED